ncbi:NUDIX hydrolase [Sulfurospirillum sp. 1612]|uniref:NUDIX hydrolase n=1 Tax=Sulfurospirillum sp. 1612 TaxID=3094835 RepID=UPI002F956965
MLYTQQTNSIFKNNYIELQNNLVKNEQTNQVFKHIKIIEKNTIKPGSVILCEYKKKIMLLELYRYGINAISWEFPRGYIEDNESLSECAIRELYEEANIIFNKETDQIIQLGETAVNSSIMASKVSLFLVKINHTIDIKLQNNENIKSISWITQKEIQDYIKNGIIIDSFTINTLMFYNLTYNY